MLPEREALPGDDEIEAALRDYHALFGGSAQARSAARAARGGAGWMQRLAGISAAPGGRRRRGLGDRAQRHPPRARRGRRQAGRNGAAQCAACSYRSLGPIATARAGSARRHAARRRAPVHPLAGGCTAAPATRSPRADHRAAGCDGARRAARGLTLPGIRAKARSRRVEECLLRSSQPRGIEREVGENRVGTGALHASQRFQHAGPLVEPAVRPPRP